MKTGTSLAILAALAAATCTPGTSTIARRSKRDQGIAYGWSKDNYYIDSKGQRYKRSPNGQITKVK